MKRKISLLIATIAATLGLGLAATPALAADGGTCSSPGYVCLYQWENLGAQVAGDHWQSSMYNLRIHSNNCVSLLSPIARWNNGTEVYHNSGSMVISGGGAYGAFIYMWTGSNCTGTFASFRSDQVWQINDLHDAGIYHTIGSIQYRVVTS